jgi:hypothetical protein
MLMNQLLFGNSILNLRILVPGSIPPRATKKLINPHWLVGVLFYVATVGNNRQVGLPLLSG